MFVLKIEKFLQDGDWAILWVTDLHKSDFSTNTNMGSIVEDNSVCLKQSLEQIWNQNLEELTILVPCGHPDEGIILLYDGQTLSQEVQEVWPHDHFLFQHDHMLL